jgi:molybdopterin-containing oxidoreductase family iron-sulfur binding subunit
MSSLKPRQWRSLDELADSAEFRKFVENEFPASAGEMLTPASRRNFLKMMGASFALAGMTACRWPREEILPFADRPDGYTPGEAKQFATSMELGGAALGLLVTSVDGRPIKIEGNPLHPSSLGGTSAVAQAAVLEMYDPERSRRVIRRQDGAHVESSWDEFEGFARETFERARSDSGARFAVLTEASSSPSLGEMRERLLRALPRARWFEYEAVSRDNERDGARLAFGRPLRPQLALDRAKVIVSLDDDLLLQHPTAVRNARDFSASRDPHSGHMSRLYVVESIYSLTGSMADHRLPVPAQMIPVVAGCLGARLLVEHGLRLPSGSEALEATLERFQAHPMYTQLDGEMARDLAAARGASLIVAGPRQPAAVHALVGVLNVALGNVGTTIELTPDANEARPSHLDSIRELAARIEAGEVDTLVMVGGNPVYDAPADLDFARLLGTVEHSVHLALHEDETSRASAWHLPRAHTLESWGDVRDWRGRYGVVQPLIEPLFGGKTPIELLALWTDDALRSGYEIVRRTFAPRRSRRRSSPRRDPRAGPPTSSRTWRAGRGWTRTSWSWSSSRIRVCTTGDSPTTPGCRSCPSR